MQLFSFGKTTASDRSSSASASPTTGTPPTTGRLRSAGSRWVSLGYRACYITGIQTCRLLHAVGRRLGRVLRPVRRFLFRAADRLVLRHLRALGAECRRVGQGFPQAGRLLAAAFRKHPWLVFPQAAKLPVLAVRRHRRAISSLLNLAAPAAAALVLVFTVQFWTSQTFGLALEYDGQTLGFIADESVYENAAALASERVINTDNSFRLDAAPRLTLAMVSKEDMLDETALCDEILRTSGDSIAEGSGLYIDGAFLGTVESRDQLNALLDSIRTSYITDAATERAEFVQQVEVVDGLYPISSVVSIEAMRAQLTQNTVAEKSYTVAAGDSLGTIARKNDMTLDQLRSLNSAIQDTDTVLVGQQLLVQRAEPYLQVKVLRTVTYTETIPHTTKQISDANQSIGYEKVRQKGQDGTRQVTAEVVLIDGVEQSRTVLSSKEIQAMVPEEVVVGTKKFGSEASKGQFIWPVPNFHNIYSAFGGRSGKLHKGIDISQSGIDKQPIVASAGGTVVEVNSTHPYGTGAGYGYGYYVVIDHGNGYATRYAHCSQILVKLGQKVSQNEIIAKVGSTGDSRGPHLHFEILYKGTPVNPTQFVR